jgi:hypothetical protein
MSRCDALYESFRETLSYLEPRNFMDGTVKEKEKAKLIYDRKLAKLGRKDKFLSHRLSGSPTTSR